MINAYGAGLFTLLALEGSLERILKVHVDLAPESSLTPRVNADALADAIALQALATASVWPTA